MQIDSYECWRESIPLSRPYTIATRTIDAVDLLFVRITSGNLVGLGSASPAEGVTGETFEACAAALSTDSFGLVGRDLHHCERIRRDVLQQSPATPAACAAIDMALYDLFARSLGIPLVDLLGRHYEALPTSITIGIKDLVATLEEAKEYVGRGFRHLKTKIGLDLEPDIERLRALRAMVGPDIGIRVDANQGYDLDAARIVLEAARALDLEFVEQPLPADQIAEMCGLPAAERGLLAADESLHGPSDAAGMLPSPPRVWNIKLMKCGGIQPARAIATIAEAAGVDLMWGCMDESAVSIAAALHAAYSCPATRYLDLDGSFDLARDPALGGFRVEGGVLHLTDEPGLGVTLRA